MKRLLTSLVAVVVAMLLPAAAAQGVGDGRVESADGIVQQDVQSGRSRHHGDVGPAVLIEVADHQSRPLSLSSGYGNELPGL